MTFHTGQTFTYGEQPSAAKWQYVWDNDDALASGSAIASGAIIDRHFASSIITDAMIDWTTAGGIWWQELARSTLGSSNDQILSGTFASRKYLMLIVGVYATGGVVDSDITFNGDTGNNYNQRRSTNGAADVTGQSTNISIGAAGVSTGHHYHIRIYNAAAQEKLVMTQPSSADGNTAGAVNAVDRRDNVAKWANTTDAVTAIRVHNSGGGDYNIGSQLVVMGHD